MNEHACPTNTSAYKATRPTVMFCGHCWRMWTYTARDWPPRKESHDPARD